MHKKLTGSAVAGFLLLGAAGVAMAQEEGVQLLTCPCFLVQWLNAVGLFEVKALPRRTPQLSLEYGLRACRLREGWDDGCN